MNAPRPQVVVLSSIDWDAAWQRHQLFAAQLAEAGHEVFFVENTGFRNPRPADLGRVWSKLLRMLAPQVRSAANTIPPGLHVVPSRALPPTGPFRSLNERLFLPRMIRRLREAGLRPGPVVIAYFATATTLKLVELLEPSVLVHDYASNFRGHPDAPGDFPAQEAALLRRTDLVVCDSNFLYEQKKTEHPHVVQLHQGVSEDFFRAKPPSPDFRRFCYYGTWIPDLDPAYLEALVKEGFDVTISGFMKGPPPPIPAIHRLPPAPREKLVERLENYDVFLLPHRINPFMMGVIPAKIYECLAMGRPVIAAPLPSILPYKDLLYIADAPEKWVRIARDLPRTETPALREARISLAREHTHRREFERLLGFIEEARARSAGRGRPDSASVREC